MFRHKSGKALEFILIDRTANPNSVPQNSLILGGLILTDLNGCCYVHVMVSKARYPDIILR